MTFVLHGGFTDALFCKWLAICRARDSRTSVRPPLSHPSASLHPRTMSYHAWLRASNARVFSVSRAFRICCLFSPGFYRSRPGLRRAPRRKLILQFRPQSLIYRLSFSTSDPFTGTATRLMHLLDRGGIKFSPARGSVVVVKGVGTPLS